jgi:membrane protease YdiL (CAAX protease family)
MVDSFSSSPAALLGPLLASRRHTAIFLGIVVGVAALGAASQSRFEPGASALAPGAKWSAYASVVALQLLLVRYVAVGMRQSGHRLRDLFGDVSGGPVRIAGDVVLAAAAAVALRTLSSALRATLGGRTGTAEVLGPSGVLETAGWVVVSVTAGVCEELTFRGYLQRQLEALGSPVPLAVVLQAAAFAVPHAYQGWGSAAVTVLWGLGFGALAAARRSLRPGILLHAGVDLVGGIFRS